MTDILTVLIVDDHEEFRRGLRSLLRTAATVETVGVASDGAIAIAMADQLQPDVILMDLHMPRLNGVEATRAITAANPHIRILVLTMFDDDESLVSALQSGARGYLLKGAGRDEILRAIHSVAAGGLILGPATATRLIKNISGPHPVTTRPVHPATRGEFPELSIREREILDLIADGANNTQISGQLFLSPKTVRNHITSIFAKLHVSDRAQAIVRARDGNATPGH